jgi:hypothetical protein
VAARAVWPPIGVLKVLEQLRVPVHCATGTSMGAVVGGIYASGVSPARMEDAVGKADWNQIFRDGPPRQEISMRRKADDYKTLFAPELGSKDGAASTGLPTRFASARRPRAMSDALARYSIAPQQYAALRARQTRDTAALGTVEEIRFRGTRTDRPGRTAIAHAKPGGRAPGREDHRGRPSAQLRTRRFRRRRLPHRGRARTACLAGHAARKSCGPD